jgi:uncharacterized protein YbjT (DUF2867 family)
MRIVVVGGTGLIGADLVDVLRDHGHSVVAASRATGINSYTGEGLAEALSGAEVVVDVSNSSYTDEAGAEEFFEISTLNLLTFGAAAGVHHHVALSVVGTDRLADTERGYFRAKFEQEKLIRASRHAYSIVHATQFFEFVRTIADAATQNNVVRVAHALVQPMAAEDVVRVVARTAVGNPVNGIREFAGPEVFRLDELVRHRLAAGNDPREVSADPLARYFGTNLRVDELLPSADAELVSTRFDDWLHRVPA